MSEEQQKNQNPLIFRDEEILNYYLSLKTKPFVILMGLSGSGKTRLALRFAKAMTNSNQGQYVFVPVEAGWIDNKNLLGYYNPLTETYNITPFLDLIIRAHNNYVKSHMDGKIENIKPYFVILDEMNLSKVEYYFSKFLSILETMDFRKITFFSDQDEPEGDMILLLTDFLPLHEELKFVSKTNSDKNVQINISTEGYNEYDFLISELIPPRIRISPNVYFTGTVNIDETTYMFSPKVLDRANSIELHEIFIKKFKEMIFLKEEDNLSENINLSSNDVIKDFTYNYKFCIEPQDFKRKVEEYSEFIDDFFDIIENINIRFDKDAPNFKFGYRVIHEMTLYIINALDLLGKNQESYNFALDYQLKQKILAKIHGMKSELENLFVKEGALDPDKFNNNPQFKNKIQRMIHELEKKQFTSYM